MLELLNIIMNSTIYTHIRRYNLINSDNYHSNSIKSEIIIIFFMYIKHTVEYNYQNIIKYMCNII